MKVTRLAAISISLFCATACTREAAEISPEAVRSYGIPSQSSNFDSTQKEKKEGDTDVSWVGSSAIVTKKTLDY